MLPLESDRICVVAVTALLIASFLGGASLQAEDTIPNTDQPNLTIQLDTSLLRLVTKPDARFINVLRDRSEVDILKNLGISTNRDDGATDRHQKKRLVFHHLYRVGDEYRHVFVYDMWIHSFPGYQPETIVICNASYAPLAWKEVGGGTIFKEATFRQSDPEGPTLRLTRLHRHTIPNPERGIYAFSLAGDAIKPRPEVDWVYESDEERAKYDEWRRWLRERQKQ